jgi:hypothetical protein
MKQIAFKGRLILRKIFTAFSFGAVAAFWSCAYGLIGNYVETTVKASDTKEPIPGIQITINGSNGEGYNEITDENGLFGFFIYSGEKDGRTLMLKDIDGPKNGEFKDKEITIYTNDDIFLTVFMDRK